MVGIAPLYISNSYYGLPLKVVAFIGTNATDYLNFICKQDDPEVVAALADGLLSATNWDAIDLHQVPDGSLVASILKNVAAYKGFFFKQIDQDICYKLSLPDSWEEYLACLSKKFRWNIQYYLRRLNRDHAISFRLSEKSIVNRDIELFFKLHQKRFLSKKKPGAYLTPSFRRFHLELAMTLSENDWLRLYFLEIDGKPVATLYGFQFADSFYYYLGGFEPDWGSLSVSTVLIAKAIEDSIASGLNSFDFLRGEEPYKQKWLAQPFVNHRLIISGSGKKSELARKLLVLENDLTKRAKGKVSQLSAPGPICV